MLNFSPLFSAEAPTVYLTKDSDNLKSWTVGRRELLFLYFPFPSSSSRLLFPSSQPPYDTKSPLRRGLVEKAFSPYLSGNRACLVSVKLWAQFMSVSLLVKYFFSLISLVTTGHAASVIRDKFLVMSTELQEEKSPSELSALWRTIPKANIVEHR